MEKTPVDLLIFDLDGTLTDSIPPAVDAIQAMQQELGYPVTSRDEINRHVGFGELALVAGAIGTADPEKVAAARAAYYKHYTEEGLPNVPLYPNVKETLEFFSPKTKVIISNKRTEFVNILLQTHRLTGYFREVLGGDNAPCLKPDPCAIVELMKKYRVEPGRTLLVGDMTVDIETGKNAGIRTCGVAYGFDGRAKLAAARPDLLIDDLGRLRELIE
jgi:phosphoglycolate phosphatase